MEAYNSSACSVVLSPSVWRIGSVAEDTCMSDQHESYLATPEWLLLAWLHISAEALLPIPTAIDHASGPLNRIHTLD